MSNCVDPPQLELKEPQCAKHIDNHKAQGNIDTTSKAMQCKMQQAEQAKRVKQAKQNQLKAKFKQRISLGGTAAILLFGLAMQASAESNYDEYLNAQSTSDASDFYDKAVLNDKIAAGNYILAGAMGLTGVKFTLDIGKLKKQLKGK